MLAGKFSGMGSSDGKITTLLIIYCVIASTGGLVSGYCMALIGPYGFLYRDSFLNKFYRVVYHRLKMNYSNPPYSTDDNYCQNNDFKEVKPLVNSLNFAALTVTFFASYTTRRLGRRHTMFISGVFFILGSTLSSSAQDLTMLFIGRILFGCGIGFTYQAVPIYLFEIAPTRIRGSLNIIFPLNVNIGILLAHFINYGTREIRGWGWRLPVGMTGILGTIFTIGSFYIVETPNSLIERGHLERGKEVLRKIRGSNSYIEPEILELVEANRVVKQVKHPFKNLVKKRNMPPLIIAVVIQTFCWFSGINFLRFYVIALFLPTIGYNKREVNFYGNVAGAIVEVIFTTTSMLFVDKIGRRKLLLEACLHMFLSHFFIAIILGIKVKDHSSDVSQGLATFVLILICTFLSSYSCSWEALSWLIPSETFSLETRSVGQSITVCVYFFSIFMSSSTFIPMLCRLKFGTLFFFSGCILAMSLFVFFFLPETKNIPIEDMEERIWKRHWFWKKFLDD